MLPRVRRAGLAALPTDTTRVGGPRVSAPPVSCWNSVHGATGTTAAHPPD